MDRSKFIKIGENLRYYRLQTGKNQREFAEECGINPVQYRRYENDAAFPRIEQLKKILNTLKKHNVINGNGEELTVETFTEPEIYEHIIKKNINERNGIRIIKAFLEALHPNIEIEYDDNTENYIIKTYNDFDSSDYNEFILLRDELVQLTNSLTNYFDFTWNKITSTHKK